MLKNMKLFKLKGNDEGPILEFFTTLDGLEALEDCHPKPAKHFIPKWWKDTPAYMPGQEVPTVKMCPSFPDYFSQGVILPMWADTILYHSPITDEFRWKSGRDGYQFFNWSTHPHYQFLDHTKYNFLGSEGSLVFKAISPWFLKTPPGYSVLQLPLFYHFDQKFSVLPGVLNTDHHYELNQQLVYHGNGEPIEIKRGTPFVQYIPFKRTDFDLKSRYATQEDRILLQQQKVDIGTKFTGTGAYRARSKAMDKKTQNTDK